MKSDWKKVKLSTVLKQIKNTFDIQKGVIYKQITVSKNGNIILREEKSGELIGTKKQTKVKAGWFIYSRLGLPDGAFGLIPQNLDGAIVTGDMPVFEIDYNFILSDYLNYILRNSVVLDFFKSKFKGSAQSRVREPLFLSLEIPLPPLPEQKRIVKKIKDIEKVSKKIKELQNYDTGTIIRSFSDNYFSNKFEEKTFKEIFNVTKLAGFEYTKHYKFIEKPEIIALRAQNVKNEGLKLNQIKYISNKLSDFLVRSKLNKNDIVVTFIGAGTGEAALIDEDNKYHCAPNIAKLTVKNQKEIDPHFALAQIRSPFVQDQIINITRQTAQPSLSMKIIRVLKFKVPPKEKQKEYMDKLNNFKKSIGALKLEKEKRNSYLTALVPSIMAKAFNGEL